MLSLNYIAPFNSLGYGQVGSNFAFELIAGGVDLSIFPIGQVENLPRINEVAESFVRVSSKYVNKKANCLKIWHQDDLYEFVGKGKHIGFPIFELDRFSHIEKHSLNHCDEIIVCSHWAVDILKNNGINRPVKVVPLGYDPNIFRPAPMLGGPTRFFNAGKWELRKGHDFILQCFEKAFSLKDNVQLIMMCDNPFPQAKGEEWAAKYKSSPLGSKISLVPRQPTHENVYYIMKQVDCGVFPARAEGWNLELLELLACGKHVITTNYSGHTEFCTKESCRLIEVDALESANDGVWFHGSGSWASLGHNQEEQMIVNMRDIHDKKQSRGQLAQNAAGIFQASQFTWNNSAKKLIEAIK